MTQIQTTDRREVNETGIVLSNMGDVQQFAIELVRSAMCPKAYTGKPHDAVIAIVAGRAVGLSPLQALSGIAVIGGRPSMFGEARAAVVLASGKAEWVKEWFELDGKTVEPQGAYDLKTFPARLTACWQAKRTDQTEPTEVVRFAVGDAKLAGLWGKSGPWSQYPLRMLRMRARAFGERDYFGDATHGIAQAEEMDDIKRHGKDKIELAVAGDEAVEQVQGEEVQPDAPEPAPVEEVTPQAPPEAQDAPQADFKAVWHGWWAAASAQATEKPDDWPDLKTNAKAWFHAWCASILGHDVQDARKLEPGELGRLMTDLETHHDARCLHERE